VQKLIFKVMGLGISIFTFSSWSFASLPFRNIAAIIRHSNSTFSEFKSGISKGLQKCITQWITHFTVKDRYDFQKRLSRGAQYRPLIERLLSERGLPLEFFYLPLIESGFLNSTSPKGASGIWQLMHNTAQNYGLLISKCVDERGDYRRLTLAAILYLEYLYGLFGSWPLVLAAYNVGPTSIHAYLKKGACHDFETLLKKKILPEETQKHVAKVLAAIEIGKNLRRHRFEIKPTEPLKTFPKLLPLPSPLSFEDITKTAHIPKASLIKYNPHLTEQWTPPDTSEYEVWVEGGFTTLHPLKKKKLQSIALAYLKELKSKRPHPLSHRERFLAMTQSKKQENQPSLSTLLQSESLAAQKKVAAPSPQKRKPIPKKTNSISKPTLKNRRIAQKPRNSKPSQKKKVHQS